MNKTGFTLIEMMVAVSIIAIAATGPLMAASRAYVAANNARDQVIASYLSQEAVEYARLRRDNDYLSTIAPSAAPVNAWSRFLADVRACATAACTYDTASGFDTCSGSGGTCTPLYLANYNGTKLYTQHSDFTGAAVTPFTRTVQFYTAAPAGAAFADATEVRVTATTTWKSHGRTFNAVVSDNLTPWQ